MLQATTYQAPVVGAELRGAQAGGLPDVFTPYQARRNELLDMGAQWKALMRSVFAAYADRGINPEVPPGLTPRERYNFLVKHWQGQQLFLEAFRDNYNTAVAFVMDVTVFDLLLPATVDRIRNLADQAKMWRQRLEEIGVTVIAPTPITPGTYGSDMPGQEPFPWDSIATALTVTAVVGGIAFIVDLEATVVHRP